MTARKEAILNLYAPRNCLRVIREIGEPPFSLTDIIRLVCGSEPDNSQRYRLLRYSFRQTLERMVDDGLLERHVIAHRKDVRYGLSSYVHLNSY